MSRAKTTDDGSPGRPVGSRGTAAGDIGSSLGGMNNDACMRLAKLCGRVGVRDSKNPEGGRLELERERFVGLLERVKRGELGR
ncbi:DUF397 domain-containing protein [Streptomyces sp. NPDC001970]